MSAIERLREKYGNGDGSDSLVTQATQCDENAHLRDIPHALSGFAHINRYWDRHTGLYGAKLLPGEFYVTRNNEFIVTVLGSCVSACIWDEVAGIGGMNHFMLPDDSNASGNWASSSNSSSARYGNVAMEMMINEILKNGGSRSRLRAKIFGGGQMLTSMTDIGQRNILFVYDYLHTEGISKIGEDVGSVYPRKVMFFPLSGRVRMKRLGSMNNDTVIQRENEYLNKMQKQPGAGEVELF
ncbi:MAG: chemoreceptor glutamine deamidase CheD [Gammaproteobacteria bacterium]|nr:MAG: chemoreceptor glutamine deamidase CheD [Gammaproteobacteria bacterium]